MSPGVLLKSARAGSQYIREGRTTAVAGLADVIFSEPPLLEIGRCGEREGDSERFHLQQGRPGKRSGLGLLPMRLFT